MLAVAHVGGLWLYSPEDVTDALLLRAPTPFSFWGVIGLGGLVVGALTGAARRRVPAALWTATHFVVASIATTSAAIHAWMIEGAMGPWSKALLCVAIVACLIAAAASVFRVRIDRWRHFKREQVLDKG
ncbi:hypothetical protein SAMN05216328_11733 [Ensifer sp. YR511]|nr:hypothetical protein SAMN05216328_11733 [Ensifer sp. YR511]